MSGFWTSELGEITGKSEDAFAKSITKIPDGTMALAKIESFNHDEYQGVKSLVVSWVLVAGDFKGAKVMQKLKVIDPDPRDKNPEKTRHRGLNMMKLMYNIFDLKPKHANTPTNEDLSVFIGKQAGIKVRETEPNAEGNTYNWVAEVHDPKGFKCETGVRIEVTHSRDSFETAFDRNPRQSTLALQDDIPF